MILPVQYIPQRVQCAISVGHTSSRSDIAARRDQTGKGQLREVFGPGSQATQNDLDAGATRVLIITA